MPSELFDKPSYEDYIAWYERKFNDDLADGRAEQWYETVTDAGLRRLEESDFWEQLQTSLPAWDSAFTADHEGYSLFGATLQPQRITKKSFESAVNKAFRWNVLENSSWPEPPERVPSTASGSPEHDPDDPQLWFGPNNWLTDFPDIFRTRLTTTYFDGVGYLAEKVKRLAEQTTPVSPVLRLQASHEGYHAAPPLDISPVEYIRLRNQGPCSCASSA